MSTNIFFGLLSGLFAAILLIVAFRQFKWSGERFAWALSLLIAALIYVGFSFLRETTVSWKMVEIVGLVIFGIIAYFGWQRNSLWLVGGWMAHSLWDILLHSPGSAADIVPPWYPYACLNFDLAVGIYLAFQAGAWNRKALLS